MKQKQLSILIYSTLAVILLGLLVVSMKAQESAAGASEIDWPHEVAIRDALIAEQEKLLDYYRPDD